MVLPIKYASLKNTATDFENGWQLCKFPTLLNFLVDETMGT